VIETGARWTAAQAVPVFDAPKMRSNRMLKKSASRRG
jgi:hypothetical protein